MDWNALSDQLARGQKVYEAFRDGAEVAAKLASLERATNELQVQYDTLASRITQAGVDLKTAQNQTEQAHADAARHAAQLDQDLRLAYQRRVAAAQADFDAWTVKTAAQSEALTQEIKDQQDQITHLTSTVSQLQDHIASLEQIKASLKASLKAQLQSVV